MLSDVVASAHGELRQAFERVAPDFADYGARDSNRTGNRSRGARCLVPCSLFVREVLHYYSFCWVRGSEPGLGL